ncbi:MAG: hypothetical protein NDJ94_22505 [Vicinamibacteria bacterium]|nr:hypothetical protein [Vicinamibacteria bacterium]
MSRGRRLAARAAAALALAVLGFAAARGAAGPRVALLGLGPNDAAWLDGFAPLFEIEPETQRATRWSGYRAEVALPLTLSGPARLGFEAARVLPETAQVEVAVAGHGVSRFAARGGRYEPRVVDLGPTTGLPARATFTIDSHDRRGLGLRFDWLAFAVGEGGRIEVAGVPRALLIVLPPLLFLVLLAGRLGLLPAAAAAAALGAGQVLLARADPFAAAHVAAKAALPLLLATTACAFVLRRHPRGGVVAAIFALSLAVKAAAVFHPGYYYPDVMNHRRYIYAFTQAEGGLVERGTAAQVAVNTAYPRYVAGKAYAFPYSPLFFVPFSWLPQGDAARDADRIEDALRLASLLAAAVQVPLAFALAARAAGPLAGVLAAGVLAAMAPMHSRLLLAMWPTVVGHLFDVGAMLAALRVSLGAAPPLAPFRWALGSCLLYISSLFNMSAFFAAFAACDRERARRWLATGAAVGVLTIGLLYVPFTLTFLREILPAKLAGGASGATGVLAEPPPAPHQALTRAASFYGPFALAAAAVGLLALRRARPAVRRTLLAWGLALLFLLSLRAFGGGLFKDLKEVLFGETLVAVLAGIGLASLADRGWRRALCGLWLAAHVAWGGARLQLLLETHRAASVRSPSAVGDLLDSAAFSSR